MSLKQKAYNIIKDRIIRCEYYPNTMLNEEKLSDELNMSRTPVRDALSRLEQERLVTILPKKGFTVAGITLGEAEQVYEIRLLMEPYAIEKYAHRIEKDVYEDYARIFSSPCENTTIEDIFRKDDDFHNLFINASNNPYFIQAYQYPYNQNIRLRAISGHYSNERIERSQNEHMSIIKECLNANWEQAANALKEHLYASIKVIQTIMDYRFPGLF